MDIIGCFPMGLRDIVLRWVTNEVFELLQSSLVAAESSWDKHLKSGRVSPVYFERRALVPPVRVCYNCPIDGRKFQTFNTHTVNTECSIATK